jgi:hypothetical protein
MRRLFPYLLVSALVACALAGPLQACSNNGEGDRCDVLADNGGNDDCQDGLVCTPRSSLNAPTASGIQTDICCPQDRSQATTTICQQPTTSVGGDAAAPPRDSGGVDTGAVDTGAVDSPVSDSPANDSAGSDAPEDSPVDAPADVETEAGD